jgi:hypothetical protein
MNFLKGIFLMSLFSMIFGSGAKAAQSQDVFPVEKFMVIEGKIDNQPVIGSFNAGYKDYSLKKKYFWCLKLAIGLDEGNLYENGLPKGEESAVANKLEDELVEKIKSLTTAHYLGHLFNDTFLDVYIYLDDPEVVHQYLQTQVNKEGLVRGIAYEIKQDPEWLLVAPFMKN